MPALNSPARVLVTGATGYVAVWVVRSLLDAGFAVRGTARSSSKAGFVQKLFSKEVESGRLEMAIVEDIGHPNAFDEAVKGVDGIAHTASPFHFNVTEPEEIIRPAVQGTIGVLRSAVKFNPDIKRIIILSSTAAVSLSRPHDGHLLTEHDWNEDSVEESRTKGRNASNPDKYSASKTLAERAAWDFYEEHKSQVGWDLVSLNPPFVYGPTLHEIPTLSSLNTSMTDLFNALCTPHAGGRSDEQLAKGGVAFVDVRDLANAHVQAFLNEKAGGERIIISAGTSTWQQILDVAHQVAPPKTGPIHVGQRGSGQDVSHLSRFDTTESGTLLKMKYLSLGDTVRDSLKDFQERGWLQQS